MTAPSKADAAAAAGILRELLAKVDSGELEAPGRRGAEVRRRVEGAILGLDIATRGPGR